MNILFVIYTLLLISIIIVVYLSYIYTINKKVLKIKDWLLIICGAIGFILITSLIDTGTKVNKKLTTEFKVPKDFYSDTQYFNDSTINDAILYNHILLMRASFPKVILCQAKIESADYSSALYKRNNNLFGMKISTSRVTTASQDGRAGYKSYDSWRESITDYVLWQLSHKIGSMSQDEYINFLGKIYAEDPKYSSKIRTMLSKINFKSLENNFEYN